MTKKELSLETRQQLLKKIMSKLISETLAEEQKQARETKSDSTNGCSAFAG